MENFFVGVGGNRYRLGMRWESLFDDLAGQLEHELQSEQADLRHEEERLRVGRLPLRDRLVALRGSPDPMAAHLRCRLRSGDTIRLRLLTVGRDWIAGDLEGSPAREQGIIPFTAIDALLMTPEDALASLTPVAERSELAARLGIGFLLRDLCRRRATVTVRTESAETSGTIDRVGRDHFDLAEHDRDVARRAGDVRQIRIVPIDNVLVVSLA